jgi:hypothetical protein
MSKICLWEMGANVTRLRPSVAFRRLGTIPGRTAGEEFSVTYYTPKALESIFSPYFEVETIKGFAKLPPPALDGLFRSFPSFLDWASTFDPAPMRGMGDHMFVILRRM